jgi:hypothetical protein
MPRQSTLFILVFSILTECSLAGKPADLSSPNKRIEEKPIRAEFTLNIGSERVNEDFYKFPTFAIGKNGQIFILDSGNSRIQCFSKEGKFLFSFGKRGQGPGELSDFVAKIRILSDGKIYVIDDIQRRINVYTQEGKFSFSAKISEYYNDIIILNDTYYLSNILLEENHKPIHASHSLGKIDADFGIFIEPAVGILKQISRLPMPEPWRLYYSAGNFTNLAAINNSELIYSQGYPYRLIKYNAQGRVLKDVISSVDFDTYQHVEYKVDSFGTSMITSPPAAAWVVFDVTVNNNNQVVVPYSNPEKNIFYIDIYNLHLILLARYRLQNVIADLKKGNYVYQSFVDNDNSLYAMVISKEDYPHLVKYKLIF